MMLEIPFTDLLTDEALMMTACKEITKLIWGIVVIYLLAGDKCGNVKRCGNVKLVQRLDQVRPVQLVRD